MRNIRPTQLKKCIFLEFVEFEEIIKECFKDVTVDASLDGITISDKNDVLDFNKVAVALAEYFGVQEVTSWHADDADFMGVWITYKDNPHFIKLVDIEDGTVDAIIESAITSTETMREIFNTIKSSEEWSLVTLLNALPDDCKFADRWGDLIEAIYY